METNVKFDFDGYTVISEGIVLSPGHVEGVQIDVEGMDVKDIPEADLKMLKEIAREHLVSSVYESSLDF